MQDISDCLSPEAQNVAEARLAAKRAARAEAREIRMKELERQQKEVEDRSDKDFADKSGRPVSSLSAATLASLGGTSSRRGSGDTSISVDTEASIREIKDSLAEVEEKYKRSMVTNAQLDNEKTSLQYQVDTIQEVLLELEEELAESRRQYEDKQKECERQKHEQGVLRFQLAEMKEALEQREALMTALERQKEFFDPVRSERDALREEVAHLREVLKKHGIALDSDGTLNGDASIENHVNSDGPPDPPVRAVSMGKTEGTMEKMETMSVVGECPPSGTEQDRQEIAQDAQKEIQLHAECGDVTSEHSEEENSSSIVEINPVDVCSHHKSETNMEEMSWDIREDKQEMSQAEVLENISEVDGETTLKQSDVSPSGSDVFQDAIDFVDETPSTMSEFYADITDCVNDCEKEEPINSQQENLTKPDDEFTVGGAPDEGAETPKENATNICKGDESQVLEAKQDSNTAETPNEDAVTICKNDESQVLEAKQDSNTANNSHEDICTALSEKITTNKNVNLIDLEHEDPVEAKIEPLQSQQEESASQTIEGQNKNDEILPAAENSDDTDQNKMISAPEQPSQNALVTSNKLVAQVESDSDKTSDVSESCIAEDEPIKDGVIPEDSGSQKEHKHVTEDEPQEDVSLESEDLKVVVQREEDILSHDKADNIQNADNTLEAESPKEIVPPEVFSSEGESTQEGDETDEDDADDDKDNGTIRSEKYTGESEIPCQSLGSSVDRQSLEDIRMEDAPDRSPRKGKGKNKDDCIVS